MEENFSAALKDIERIHKLSEKEMRAAELADQAAEELAGSEFQHYLNHEVNPDYIRIAEKYGLFGLPISEEYGGSGSGLLSAVLVNQRFGQLGLGFPTFYDVNIFIGASSLARWGTEEQKSACLKPLAHGKSIIAFGLTEPEAGSEPTAMKTTYTKEGSEYVLNGTKYLITNGSIADHIIIFAKSEEDGKSITAFLVKTKENGFSVEMNLHEKIGLFTSDTAMLRLENLHAEKENILGEEGKGMHVAYSALLNGRLGIASGCIGVIEGSLKAAVSRAQERVQHGKLIGKHQLIQRHIAEIRENLEMARWPTYSAALRKSEYDKNPSDRTFTEEMDLRTALAKKIASRLAFESADRAVQVYGGFGYSLLAPVGALFCDSRVSRIYEGTDEIMELKIAEGVLGKGFEAFE